MPGRTSLFGNWPKVTLGRVYAIPIRVDATFVIVPYFLLKWPSSTLAAEYWFAFTAGVVGIFLSILLHEFGHAFTAKFQRVGVSVIVIGGFYGYANLKRQAISRGQRIRILAVGPLANLVIFLALWMALWVSSPTDVGVRGLMAPAGAALSWERETARMLAFVNLAMFLFNSIPAFPLDGGKILGLFLDRILSVRASTRIVSSLSILVGSAMVLFGFGHSIILAIIGFMIVMTNLRRLRRLPAPRSNV